MLYICIALWQQWAGVKGFNIKVFVQHRLMSHDETVECFLGLLHAVVCQSIAS